MTPHPLKLHLYPPSPNPSSDGGTWIPWWISTPSNVSIQVYSLAGELVRKLEPQFYGLGVSERFWDQRNEAGQKVASGVFVYRVLAESPQGESVHDFSKCAVLR